MHASFYFLIALTFAIAFFLYFTYLVDNHEITWEKIAIFERVFTGIYHLLAKL